MKNFKERHNYATAIYGMPRSGPIVDEKISKKKNRGKKIRIVDYSKANEIENNSDR